MPQNANGAGSIRKKTVRCEHGKLYSVCLVRETVRENKKKKPQNRLIPRLLSGGEGRDSNWRSGVLSTVK